MLWFFFLFFFSREEAQTYRLFLCKKAGTVRINFVIKIQILLTAEALLCVVSISWCVVCFVLFSSSTCVWWGRVFVVVVVVVVYYYNVIILNLSLTEYKFMLNPVGSKTFATLATTEVSLFCCLSLHWHCNWFLVFHVDTGTALQSFTEDKLLCADG